MRLHNSRYAILCEESSFEFLPLSQKHCQRMPRVLVSAHGAMRHLQTPKELLVRFHKSIETR